MSVPALALPSQQSIKIRLREPKISDCFDNCDNNDRHSEKITTQFLNLFQLPDDKTDAGKWTGADRITALWWLFLEISADKTISFEYECNTCGEMHFADVDMKQLTHESKSLSVPPFIISTIHADGIEHEIKLKPLNGDDLQQLEVIRNALPENTDSIEYKKAYAELKVAVIVFQFELTKDDSFEKRVALVESMGVNTEFGDLVAQVTAMNETLRHGLRTYTDEVGIMSIVSMPIKPYCQKDKTEGEIAYQRLLMPFRGQLFIPTI